MTEHEGGGSLCGQLVRWHSEGDRVAAEGALRVSTCDQPRRAGVLVRGWCPGAQGGASLHVDTHCWKGGC